VISVVEGKKGGGKEKESEIEVGRTRPPRKTANADLTRDNSFRGEEKRVKGRMGGREGRSELAAAPGKERKRENEAGSICDRSL